MKYILLFILAAWTYPIVLHAEEVHDVVCGKRLIAKFPPAQKEIDFSNVRTNNHLSISEVVRCGDRFLKSHFGDELKCVVYGVSYIPMTVAGGRMWCWTIRYAHPEQDGDGLRVFSVYLDQQGNPLMEVAAAK